MGRRLNSGNIIKQKEKHREGAARESQMRQIGMRLHPDRYVHIAKTQCRISDPTIYCPIDFVISIAGQVAVR